MRWVIRGLLGVVGVIVLAVAGIYAASEWIIREGHAVPTDRIAVPTDLASVAEGARLARIASCRECHAANGQGKVLFEDPMLGRVAPPPLAKVAAGMTNEDLVRAVRYGVHKDGSSLFIMPSYSLGHLSDEDLGKIVAWIRTLRQGPGDSRATMAFGPVGRALIVAGKLPPMATAAKVAEARRPADVSRYLVDFSCASCHKLHQDALMEDGATRVPALAPMAAAYDPAKFRKLLRTGVDSKPDHGIMSVVARESFAVLTDAEIAGIQAYLKAEAEKAPAR